MRLPHYLFLLLAGVCACTSRSNDDVDAEANAVADGPSEGDAARLCRFGSNGDPSTLPGTRDIVNAPSERLLAPRGGLWWVATTLPGPTVIAQTDALGPIELEVFRPPTFAPNEPLATIRVPSDLPVDTRLELGARELVVQTDLPKLSFDEITMTLTYRADLGGTGGAFRVAPEQRSRVYVDGYVAPVVANVMTGIKVLERLLLSDAQKLCEKGLSEGTADVFVPMWVGRLPPMVSGLAFYLLDADDPQNYRVERAAP